MHGEKSKVKLGKEVNVEVAILAPTATIKGKHAYAGNLIGKRVKLRGVQVWDVSGCGTP